MTALAELVRAIVDDPARAAKLVRESPALAAERVVVGATRQSAKNHFLLAIRHYVYAGDTALHVAAAAYRTTLVTKLIAVGADVHATNRRGATALHYAVDGGPGAPHWNPRAQVATIARLLAAGADPNATDRSGTRPLHRAVRNRCAAAVRALLDGGADPRLDNGRGSMVKDLLAHTTGRSGSGSDAARAQRDEIAKLLAGHR
jgi:ankyrin repeat protein